MKVLLSIKPEFVEKIIRGEKKYEYRKRIFKKHVEKIWLETSKYSGVEKDFFMEYFRNKDKGYALKISEVTTFDEPIDPKEKFDNFITPQSFKYIEDSLMG